MRKPRKPYTTINVILQIYFVTRAFAHIDITLKDDGSLNIIFFMAVA